MRSRSKRSLRKLERSLLLTSAAFKIEINDLFLLCDWFIESQINFTPRLKHKTKSLRNNWNWICKYYSQPTRTASNILLKWMKETKLKRKLLNSFFYSFKKSRYFFLLREPTLPVSVLEEMLDMLLLHSVWLCRCKHCSKESMREAKGRKKKYREIISSSLGLNFSNRL